MFRKISFLSLFLIFSSCDQQIEDDRYDNYRPLRVAVSQQVPVNIVTKLPNGTYRYEGIASNHFYYMAQKLKRPLEIVVPSDEDSKKFGRTQACFNQVVNGEADVSAMAIGIESEQLNLVDLTFPTAMSLFKMLVPSAKEESRLIAFVRPFQSTVWLFLLVSLVGSVIATSGLNWLYFRIKQDNQIVGRLPNSRLFSSFVIKYCVYTVGIMTSHACSNPFNRNGLRIFGALWLLVMTVLVYAYSGLLIGCLTVPLMTKPIETLEDVAASTEVILRINPNELSGLGKAVMEGKSGVWKALGDQLRRHSDGLYKDSTTEEDFSVAHRNYATPHLPNLLVWRMRQMYKKEKKCRFHLSKSIPFSVRYVYVVRKGDGDSENINLTIMELRENGLLDFYSNEALYIPGSGGSEQCFKKVKNSAKDTPIKLMDLTSAFFILGIGIRFAILCFLLELIVGKCKREMRDVVVSPAIINQNFDDSNISNHRRSAIEAVTEKV